MAMRFEDLLEETATYSGGQFTLGGAVAGRRPFSAALDNGDMVFVRAAGVDTPEEWLLAAMRWAAAGNRLTVEQIVTSSTGGAEVAFSGAVRVACVQPAAGVVAIGRPGAAPKASDDDSVAAGSGAIAGRRSTAIGSQARANDESISVGWLADCAMGGSIAIGRTAVASKQNSVALGAWAEASYRNSTAIGGSAKTWAEGVTSMGPAAFAWSKRLSSFFGAAGMDLVVPSGIVILADVYVVIVNSALDQVWSGRTEVCVQRSTSGSIVFAGGAAPTVSTVAETGPGYGAQLILNPPLADYDGTLRIEVSAPQGGYCMASAALYGVALAYV